MAFPIIPKRRSGATGNPSTLELGELATNTQTGELFLGGDGGVMLLNPPTAAGTTVTEHTGDGTTVAFTFTGYNGTSDGGYLVSVGGIDQPPSKYSVSATAGGTITFVEAPVAGEIISIRAIVAGGGGGGSGITELTGDVTASGTGSVAATVARIQGVPVAALAPAAGQMLGYDGTNWAPAPAGASNAVKIQNIDVSETAPAVGEALVFQNILGDQKYFPTPLANRTGYPEFNGGSSYNEGDIVECMGKLYVALQFVNGGGAVPSHPARLNGYWAELIGGNGEATPIDPTTPVKWWRVRFAEVPNYPQIQETYFIPLYQ